MYGRGVVGRDSPTRAGSPPRFASRFGVRRAPARP
jgi:hypothetical protein